jgi:hypothetical protein
MDTFVNMKIALTPYEDEAESGPNLIVERNLSLSNLYSYRIKDRVSNGKRFRDIKWASVRWVKGNRDKCRAESHTQEDADGNDMGEYFVTLERADGKMFSHEDRITLEFTFMKGSPQVRLACKEESDLRKKVIRLAHDKAELRPHLLPLLKEARTRPRNILYLIEIYLKDSPSDVDAHGAGMSESYLTLRDLAKVQVEDDIIDVPLRDMDWEKMEVLDRGNLVRVETARWEQPVSYDMDKYIGRYAMDIEREDGQPFTEPEIKIIQGMLGIRRVRTR